MAIIQRTRQFKASDLVTADGKRGVVVAIGDDWEQLDDGSYVGTQRVHWSSGRESTVAETDLTLVAEATQEVH